MDPSEVEAIFDDRIQNLSATDVSGIDFSGRYDFGSDIGRFWLSVSGSYLLAFDNKVTPVSEVDDTLNTFLNPIDLRLRGGITWGDGGWTVGGYVNHQGSYDNDLFIPAFDIDSWTTVDLAVSYAFGFQAAVDGGDGTLRFVIVTCGLTGRQVDLITRKLSQLPSVRTVSSTTRESAQLSG